jgi:hypothetical protein
MILPTKHLRTDRSLISIGAEILRILTQPKTISKVWDEFRVTPLTQKDKASINYDWFILSIDLLYVLGAVSFERGLLQKKAKI